MAEIAGEFIAPIKSALADVAGVQYRGIKYSNFDLVRDIGGIRGSLESFLASGGSQSIHAQEIQVARAKLASRYTSGNVGGLRRATVGDFLDPAFKGLSDRAKSNLEWARKTGLVSAGMPLTRGGGGLFVGQAGKIVDARMLNPRFAYEQAAGIAEKIRVPFTRFRPATLITSLVDRFLPQSATEFSGVVGRGIQVAPGIKTPKAFSYVLGGELRSYTPAGFKTVAENIQLGKVGMLGDAHLQRYGRNLTDLGAELHRSVEAGGRSGVRGTLDKVQYAMGIGPAFRTKDQFFKSKVIDPILRRERGTLVKAKYVTRAENDGFFGKIIGGIRDSIEAENRGVPLREIQREAVPNTRPLTLLDKIAAHFGASRRAHVVRPGVSTPSHMRDLERPPLQGKGFLAGTHEAPIGAPAYPGPLGATTTTLRNNEHYAYRAGVGEAVADVANFFTNRLNDLIGWTTGVGFRPTLGQGTLGGLKAAGVNLAKIYGIYGLGAAGVGYLGYADHLVESVTSISPKKLAIQAYAGLRLGQQVARQATGISAGANYLEDLMPRSVESGASWFARTVLPLAIGTARGGLKGLMGGAAVTAAIGGTDVGQSPSDLYEEYIGEKLVPIRKSRYWMLGRQPFEGGQIDYFAPSWVARELSDYKHTSTLYGSKGEYYSHVANISLPIIGSVPLPTPSNAFGLTNLLDGDFFGGGHDYLSAKHVYDRPYPDSPGVNKEQAIQMAQYLSSAGPYDPPVAAGARLGAGALGGLGDRPRETGGLGGRIADATDRISELGGIYKFLFWNGPRLNSDRPALASASEMGSASRAFYDEQVGGLLGGTELLRRFIPPPERSINPIPNTMPNWLPGIRSENPDDRRYHIDFTLGDPYAKLKMGEFRLPGEAYERLHRLHSGTPGVYDAMDRYLILSDVAPNSRARKEYQAIVEGWEKAGVLDDYWAKKLSVTKDQIKKKMEKFDFVHRRFTGLITDPNPEKTSQKYNFLEKAVGGAWERLTHDVVPAIGDAVPLFGPMLSDKMLVARSPVEQYLHSELYGEEYADWRSPWESFLRPKIDRLVSGSPVSAIAGGLGLGAFGATPLASAALGITGATLLGGRSAIRAITNETYIPGHRNQQWELEEYFDSIRYAKARGLESQAAAVGDTELQSYYANEMSRTSIGVNYQAGTKEFISSAMRGLPRSMRPFLLPFTQMPRETQESVLPYLPTHLQAMFATSWMKTGQAPSNIRDFAGVYNATADERLANYFSNNPMPGPEWAGWHPDVPLDTVKMKMVDTGTNSVAADIHKFELFPEHRFRASRFAGIEIPEVDDLQHPEMDGQNHLSLQRMLEAAGFRNVNISPGVGPGSGSGVSWGLRYDNISNLRESVRGFFR
jgi:hypothetical protein